MNTRYLLLGLLAGLTAAPSSAAIVFNVNEVGSNVQVSASGTLNTAGLSQGANSQLAFAAISAQVAFASVGTQLATGTFYNGVIGPKTFGSGGPFSANSSGGDVIGLGGQAEAIFLPSTYLSGAALSGFAIYNGQTFASLGLQAGQYIYAAGQDRITVNIGDVRAAVPEPAAWATMLIGFGVIGGVARRRSRALV